MIINNNLAANNTHRQLSSVSNFASKSMERLSSGMRINRAADDAAGLSISENMRNQIRGLNQAERNAQDGISLIQTAEGGLNEMHSILQRVRELTVQAGNGTNSDNERGTIQNEIEELVSEIDSIAGRTEFNGEKLLETRDAAGDLQMTGTTADPKSITLQIGANQGQQLTFEITAMNSETLGTDAGTAPDGAGGTVTTQAFRLEDIDVKNFDTATGGTSFDDQLGAIDAAIKQVSDLRSNLGATQNRLEYNINSLKTSAENITSAESRIRDVDMAKEMMSFTKNNILSQAAQSMLAQANQQPQAVLQLLR